LIPNDAKAYGNRALGYLIKADYDNAIADCDQSIRLDPNRAASYVTRGAATRAKLIMITRSRLRPGDSA